jgi:hypothetical protein
LPVGTKVTPLHVVAPGSGMTISAIADIEPPASVKCPSEPIAHAYPTGERAEKRDGSGELAL